MTIFETDRDLDMKLWDTEFTVPQGTEVELIKGASGTQGDLYAVKSVPLLKELSMNHHDPVYRYCFVPTDAVIERAPAPSPR